LPDNLYPLPAEGIHLLARVLICRAVVHHDQLNIVPLDIDYASDSFPQKFPMIETRHYY
jgi:hypothetical protein